MTLAHVVEGDGPAVVLSGSLGATLAMFEPQAAALRGRFRVVRYDHPGHGGSPPIELHGVDSLARGVVELLDQLGLERASFCGVSLGGAVGMHVALDAPERLDRLVLACTSARFGSTEIWDERIALVRTSGMEAVADVLMPRWFTPSFRNVRTFRAMVTATPPDVYVGYCELLRGFDLRGSLGTVRAPTLAIAGADDPTSPPSDLHAIAESIPGARVVAIDGARHLANVERADAFNDALLEHLA